MNWQLPLRNPMLTKIDRWFLVQIKEVVDFKAELAATKN